ncbi:squalene--hopene cyclase [Halobacillus sp. BBL2006]|uniref:squalene--hopene cyclase n=1 Tax=Halobacillus sp. BBL2006 TaxID=1543706 RepID=UPI0005437FA1|nr:squalene--hopene cyclase [Halobacillus sp. BBL2006]KHE72190.1 squalene-hopene cyclase [Halobacillus sp. BBL2006]
MNSSIESEINRLIQLLNKEQSRDGSWNYAFETGIITDAYMIILLRLLEIHDEELIDQLVGRIISKQQENGAWKLFYDEESGNLSSTIEAYTALLFSGKYKKSDPELVKARTFIVERGGVKNSELFTKILLCLIGQYPWPKKNPIPIEVILLPPSFPVNIFDISVFGRANIIPILLLAHKKYQSISIYTPDLSDIGGGKGRNEDDSFVGESIAEEWRNYFTYLIDEIKSKVHTLFHFESEAIAQAKNYMLTRIEPDGTMLSYFSSTFYMVMALRSVGYKKDHAVILKAIEGLKSIACKIDGYTHMQYTTADVWNTALISDALQKSGVPADNSVIKQANSYLLSRQQYKFADWMIHNPETLPGGWGFSDINTLNPDVDDTTASLRALRSMFSTQTDAIQAWNRGVQWTLSMQNPDGGWPAFERRIDKEYLTFLPLQKAEFILTDASSADLTGRTLEFLGNYTNMDSHSPPIVKAKKWLKNNQRKDGSWYGRWGICYLYGTWAALTGLMACEEKKSSPAVQRSVKWLSEIQNRDGGWGESCNSDIERRYVPLGSSTLTHTSWALDALIAVIDKPSPAIDRGIQYLITNGEKNEWTEDYPKGQGMGGAFYVHYHSYRFIWPLMTLAHYQNKFL